MPKLIFETDDGKQSEISLKTIQSKSLKSGDIVFAYYEIGDVVENDAITIMQKLQVFFEKLLPDDVKCVVIATRNGKEDIKLKIVKDKT
jgi:hypothetical protein